MTEVSVASGLSSKFRWVPAALDGRVQAREIAKAGEPLTDEPVIIIGTPAFKNLAKLAEVRAPAAGVEAREAQARAPRRLTGLGTGPLAAR
jgi:hypothetical protein